MSNNDLINLHELKEEIEQKFSTLDTLARLGWGMIVTGFAFGVWVTTIQLAINQHERAIEVSRVERNQEMASIKALEMKDAADTQLLKVIVEKLDRIDRKLNP
jgi:hypothetical protein